MVNYANGKIYKIEHVSGEGDVYIGSTTKEYLSQRIDKHRSCYKQWKAGKRCHIRSFDLFEKYGVEHCRIVLLEAVLANSKDQLLARESFYIRSLECVNKVIPDRSKAEYYTDNREKINQRAKDFYADNREKVLQKMKEKYTKEKYTCVCGSIIIIVNKYQHERSEKHKKFIEKTVQSSPSQMTESEQP
jgi:hypothetical protein